MELPRVGNDNSRRPRPQRRKTTDPSRSRRPAQAERPLFAKVAAKSVEQDAGNKKLKNSHNNPLPRRIVPVSRASGASRFRFRLGEDGESLPSTLLRNRSHFSWAGAFGPRGHGAVWTGSDREVGSVLVIGRSDFFLGHPPIPLSRSCPHVVSASSMNRGWTDRLEPRWGAPGTGA